MQILFGNVEVSQEITRYLYGNIVFPRKRFEFDSVQITGGKDYQIMICGAFLRGLGETLFLV